MNQINSKRLGSAIRLGSDDSSPSKDLQINVFAGGSYNEHGVLQIAPYDYTGSGSRKAAIVTITPGTDAPPTGQINSELILYNKTGSDYERFAIAWYSSAVIMDITKQGAGTVRPFTFCMGSNIVYHILAGGNIGIQTTTPRFPLQINGRLCHAVPDSSPVDADIPVSHVTAYLDEANSRLKFRIRTSKNTIKEASVNYA